MIIPPYCKDILKTLLDQLYSMLPPKEARLVTKGKLFSDAQLSQDPDVKIVQRIYNVTCLISNEIVEEIEKCDSETGLNLYLGKIGNPLFGSLYKQAKPIWDEPSLIVGELSYYAASAFANSLDSIISPSEEFKNLDSPFKQGLLNQALSEFSTKIKNNFFSQVESNRESLNIRLQNGNISAIPNYFAKIDRVFEELNGLQRKLSDPNTLPNLNKEDALNFLTANATQLITLNQRFLTLKKEIESLKTQNLLTQSSSGILCKNPVPPDDIAQFENTYKNIQGLISVKRQEIQQEITRYKEENIKNSEQHYQRILTSISTINNFLITPLPEHYDRGDHQKLKEKLAELEAININLTEQLTQNLPHSEYPLDANAIQDYQSQLNNTYESTNDALLKRLSAQKQKFFALLTTALNDTNNTVLTEVTQQNHRLSDAFNKRSAQAQTSVANYDDVLKLSQEWLAANTPIAIVTRVVQAQGDVNLVQTWVDEFVQSETYKVSAAKLDERTKPLVQTIENQKLELDSANQGKIIELAKDIKALQERIPAGETLLEEIDNLKIEHQQALTNAEKQAHALNPEAINLIQKINFSLEAATLEKLPNDGDLMTLIAASKNVLKSIEEKSTESETSRSPRKVASPSTPPPNPSSTSTGAPPPPPSSRVPQQVSDRTLLLHLNTAITQPDPAEELEKIRPRFMTRLENMIDENNRDEFKVAINNLKNNEDIDQNIDIVKALLESSMSYRSIILEVPTSPLPSSVASSNTQSKEETYHTLKASLAELDAVLAQQKNAFKDAIEKLNQAHNQAIAQKQQAFYKDIPEEKKANPLGFLKQNLALKQAQLEASTLRTSMIEANTKLAALTQSVQGIIIPNLAFQVAHGTFQEQLLLNSSTNQVQLSNTVELLRKERTTLTEIQATLTQLQGSYDALTTKISLLTTTDHSAEVNALKAMQETIKKDLDKLQPQLPKLETLLNGHDSALEQQKAILQAENAKAAKFNAILVNIGIITGAATLQTKQIKAHQYDASVVQKLIEGKLHNPSYIIAENQFHQTANQKKLDLETQLTALKNEKIVNPSSPLDTAINQALDAKIATAQAAITTLQIACTDRKVAWDNFVAQNSIINDSLNVSTFVPGNAAPSAANATTANFDNANFKGVILDQNTQLDWKTQSGNILLHNLGNPFFQPTQANYIPDLITTVTSKVPIEGEWVLDILKKIGTNTSARPWTHAKKDDLITQQNHAVFVIKQLIPKMTSIDEILKLKDLVETKHDEDKNPYGYIRRELDVLRFKYGNTQPWKEIMETIQTRLDTLTKIAQTTPDDTTALANNAAAPPKLTLEQYKAGKKIMKTHVEHDYGFGWFRKPAAGEKWKENKPETPEAPKLAKK